jgi:hypothetical protein
MNIAVAFDPTARIADDRSAFAAEFKTRIEERRRTGAGAPAAVGNEELPRAYMEQMATKREGTFTPDPETHDVECAQHVERVREGFEHTQPEQANGKTAMIAVRLPVEERSSRRLVGTRSSACGRDDRSCARDGSGCRMKGAALRRGA